MLSFLPNPIKKLSCGVCACVCVCVCVWSNGEIEIERDRKRSEEIGRDSDRKRSRSREIDRERDPNRLYIAMQEILGVDVFQAGHKLVRQQQHCFEGEFPAAEVEQILQGGAQEVQH